MCNAVPFVGNRESPMCGICHEDFVEENEKWTHEGGQNHIPFHKRCLIKWLRVEPTCPIDRTFINPDSLISRTEGIFEVAKQTLVNSACAIGISVMAGVSASTGVVTGAIVAKVAD